MDWQGGSDSIGLGSMGFEFDPCDHRFHLLQYTISTQEMNGSTPSAPERTAVCMLPGALELSSNVYHCNIVRVFQY